MTNRARARWPKKLGVGLLIAVTMLAIAEVTCRFALGPEPIGEQSPIYASAETIGFRIASDLRLGSVNTNSFGFRSREVDGGAAEKILVLGDSMTFGAQVKDDETFCSLLEVKVGAPRQVLNASCPGYGPWEEGVQLGTIGAVIKPDRVLVVFFAGNDFQDAGRDEAAYCVIGGRLVSQRQYQSTSAPVRALKNLLASTWSWGLVRAVRQVTSRQRGEVDNPDGGPAGMDSPQIRCILELPDYARAAERNEPLVARGWARMESHFTKLHETCAALGAPLTVVILPLPIVYDPDLRVRLAKRWSVAPASIDAERPSRNIAELLGRLGISTIDLTADLRANPLRGKLHLPGDLHFSTTGHDAVAAMLATKL